MTNIIDDCAFFVLDMRSNDNEKHDFLKF